jgi:hypothetical protein
LRRRATRGEFVVQHIRPDGAEGSPDAGRRRAEIL